MVKWISILNRHVVENASVDFTQRGRVEGQRGKVLHSTRLHGLMCIFLSFQSKNENLLAANLATHIRNSKSSLNRSSSVSSGPALRRFEPENKSVPFRRDKNVTRLLADCPSNATTRAFASLPPALTGDAAVS